ncbi:uncharacterized protein JCM15063_005445 [Sporobolomyces koalae]|uniref:uncharacterized protein n=1 Tax=Sporobolomyces koalae TaxID=500713 RepID=UPI00318104FA
MSLASAAPPELPQEQHNGLPESHDRPPVEHGGQQPSVHTPMARTSPTEHNTATVRDEELPSASVLSQPGLSEEKQQRARSVEALHTPLEPPHQPFVSLRDLDLNNGDNFGLSLSRIKLTRRQQTHYPDLVL